MAITNSFSGQPKHRTQDRNDQATPSENKPTDRSKNADRAKGTKYNQPNQPEHQKTNNRNKNY